MGTPVKPTPSELEALVGSSRLSPFSELVGTAQAYTPTWRERSVGLLQDALEKIGAERYRARQISENVFGGQSSNLPMKAGLADLSPIGAIFARQEASERGTPMGPGAPPGLLAAALPAARTAKATDDAMRAVGYERGWFRGGPAPKDNRMTGPWYTRNADEAADYSKRFGSNADVREYAIPSALMLKMDLAYAPRLHQDVAAKAESNFGASGAKLAALIRANYTDVERASGMELWRAASKTLGDDAAASLFGSLGFRSVLGVNSPDYVRLLPGATARDANKAAFDPQKIGLDNIMAGVGGLGLLGAAIRSPGDE